MTTFKSKARLVLSALVISFAILWAQSAGAQTFTGGSNTADEQAIRSLVAQLNAGKMPTYTDDRIFVSGAFPKPIIGKELVPENKAADERLKKERSNFRSTSNIQRLEIAKAGDMAYEFGTANLSWDNPEKKQVSLESTYLRVWRKIDGVWKVDVFFARPNEEPKIN